MAAWRGGFVLAHRFAGDGNAIGDPTLADAALDRLVHNANRINLTGESMRKTRAALTNMAAKDE